MLNYDQFNGDLAPKLQEYCQCDNNTTIKLAASGSRNPFSCLNCDGTIDPRKLILTQSLIDQIAAWHRVAYSCLELWLDSAGYELWAKSELCNFQSEVNLRGMELTKRLSTAGVFYYLQVSPCVEMHSDDLKCMNCKLNVESYISKKCRYGLCNKCHLAYPIY